MTSVPSCPVLKVILLLPAQEDGTKLAPSCAQWLRAPMKETHRTICFQNAFKFQLHVCGVGVGMGQRRRSQSTCLLSSPPEFEKDSGGKEGRAVIPKMNCSGPVAQHQHISMVGGIAGGRGRWQAELLRVELVSSAEMG